MDAEQLKKEEEKKVEEKEEEEEEEEEEAQEEPEEDDPERLPEDPEPYPEKCAPGEVELTDEQMDKQGELKQAAAEALEDGDQEKALAKYTEAILVGNATAMMYTKRAELLLKMKRPKACISDCDAATGINPDSAKAYRLRGKSYRKLGNWGEAHTNLSTAQKLDFDDDTADVAKLVAEKWKKGEEKRTKQRIKQEARDKKKKEEDFKRRKAEAVRAYEEAKAAEAQGGGFPGGMGGFPGGMGGMGGMGGFPGGMGGMPDMGGMGGMPGGMDPAFLQGLMSDPELMQAFQNPKFMTAMQDIMSNPANMSKYQSDPEVMALINKVMGKMGGMGGGMGGMGGGGVGPSSGGGGSEPTFTCEEVPDTGVDEVD